MNDVLTLEQNPFDIEKGSSRTRPSTMSFSINLPPSVVSKKTKSEEQDEPKKKSREDWRKQKELEEMRKAGTAPAMTDEEGK